MGFTGREPPFFFLKPADAVLPVPKARSARCTTRADADLHHEVELVVAIGKARQATSPRRRDGHVWGYAVGLDMTRRDLQGEAKKQGRPWDIGKASSSRRRSGDPRAARCKVDADTRDPLDVNGTERQHSTIGKLIWTVREIIEHLSAAWTWRRAT